MDIRGVLLSLKKDDVMPYSSVLLDAQGKEIKREKLRNAGGISYRIAPPPDTSATPRWQFWPTHSSTSPCRFTRKAT